MSATVAHPLTAGQLALDHADWSRARARFTGAAAVDGEPCPERGFLVVLEADIAGRP
jgi:hypothetical protein